MGSDLGAGSTVEGPSEEIGGANVRVDAQMYDSGSGMIWGTIFRE